MLYVYGFNVKMNVINNFGNLYSYKTMNVMIFIVIMACKLEWEEILEIFLLNTLSLQWHRDPDKA